jgi:hypothetical protein
VGDVFLLVEVADDEAKYVREALEDMAGMDIKCVVEVVDVHVSGRGVEALKDVTLWCERGQ